MFLYLICAVIATVNGAPLNSTIESDGRIVGGESISIEDAPYQVSIIDEGIHMCGGAIISPQHVITAAHCVNTFSPRTIRVNAGSSDARFVGSIHKIIGVTVHKKFAFSYIGIPRNDIAVLKVYPPFKYGASIQPITLSNRKLLVGQLVTITGYGANEESGVNDFRLKGVTVPVYNKYQCSKSYLSIGAGSVGDEFFCAGFKQGRKDACQGDSGGPVISNGKLVGIVSYGEGCARPNMPGVYTDVFYYNNWLKTLST